MMVNWTKEWPTCPGYYWFIGWPLKYRYGVPKLHFVVAVRGHGGLSFVTNGHFLYEVEGGEGYWSSATVSVLPDELYEGLVEQMEDPWNLGT